MMRKWLSGILAVMLLGLTACGTASTDTGSSDIRSNDTEVMSKSVDTATEEVKTLDNADSKSLVVYFSRSGENWNVGTVEKGSTQLVAEYIADKTGAEIYRIEPVTPYPDSYSEMLKVAEEEQKENKRPEIKTPVDNWEQYDRIYLGYPIWDGDMPMIVYSFLESQDFSGKIIYPFDTHGGSGLAGTVGNIKNSAAGADVMDGLGILGEDVQKDFNSLTDTIDSWLDK